ncbi:dead-box ATP-dependent RNA helicase 50 domain containing protein [Babesia gibsoni]|uniref:Dead-box ATP-dependent RNA helicase 50 domain containing protein n=1 Tax=Babesia gibsoni TaxID=33632 RepID=A0AAD8PFD1_BABGI|nr:dead-box ATP-dependent RNA helicase 50 domain containing protein [Babesia gibsoni]
MQQSAHSHFLGYLGQRYEDEIKPRLEEIVQEHETRTFSVSKCAQGILREFMTPLIENFTIVENMEPHIALDRELQVLYSADLAASYILLFCPLKVKQELYRYLWSNGAFLDGRINWLCCPWVLNQEKHDEGYHKLALDLGTLSNEELIDIIRLHKNYLSTDYVKQRSRGALRQLDRDSLLSVFQSVMIRVLWGREVVTENQNALQNDDAINSEEDFKRIQSQIGGSEVKKEDIGINTLSGWLEEYRSKRGYATPEKLPAPRKLQLRETEYARQMKRSLDVIQKHMDNFNEVFRGVPGDTPFVEAARMKSSEKLPIVDDIGYDITLSKIRSAFKTLLDFYQSNLSSCPELYGSVRSLKALKLLKFLLSYEKHELIRILSAVLLALPEFKPITNEQDFAQYSMIPFNTIAKLCFIAIMRINPEIGNMGIDTELNEEEIKANIGNVAMSGTRPMHKTADAGNTETPDLDDIHQGAESSSDSEEEDNVIASMIFTSDELLEISGYINRKICNIVKADIGTEKRRCLVLDSRRTRHITESIIMHMSNYEAVYEMLENYDIETPIEGNEDQTMEEIRKYKLRAVIKRMDDQKLNELYDKVIESAKVHEEIKIPDEIYKLNHHCLLDNIEGELQEDQIYSKLTEVLKRMQDEEEGGDDSPDMVVTQSVRSADEDGDANYDAESETTASSASGTPGHILTQREHYLNLIEGEDITAFVDDTFSSHNAKEMTDDELRRISEKVLERMEASENSTVIHYNPVSTGKDPFHLNAIPYKKVVDNAFTGFKHYSLGGHIFKLNAQPYDTFIEHMADTDAHIEQENDVREYPEYGVGIFPKRTAEKMPYSWQFPETMQSYKLLRNRVTQDDVESYTNSWQDLGLRNDVASAAAAWIRKSILDTIGKSEQAGLEIEPTEIQKMAINHMLKYEDDVLIASNAASGKTLAYLLPIIQKLKEHEKHKLRHPNSPRALILVPSRELSDQILGVLKELGHIVKFSSESICGGYYKGRQRDHMKRLVDIVVATPERLMKMIKHVKLNKLKYLVLDEADTLLNEGFWPEVSKILDFIKHPYTLVQVAASSKYLLHFEKVQKALAKVPNMKGIPNKTPEMNEKYLKRLTQCHQLVETAWVDRPNRGVTHEFRYLKGEDKALELCNLLKYESARRCNKVLVFCNSIQSCRAVEYILRDAGLPATSLHGKIPIMQRRKYYEDFINGSTGIMVCSDLASRGLDFNADVVIMFDFPLNSMEYLKRCGRVGRMINNDMIAPKGYAISLVKKRDQNLARAIERSIRMPFFPISNLSRRKEDYNQRSGRLRYLTQAGGYFKLSQLIREEEIKGTYDYSNMDKYLEDFKAKAKEMYQNSLKKLVLRRRRICKRRRILLRRLKLMKRYNKAVRLKQRIISQSDRNRRLKRFSVHSPMKGDDRRCPPMKDLRPIRAKILELKIMEDKMTRRLLERNDRSLRKFINKTQKVARSMAKPEVKKEEAEDRMLPLTIIERAKEKIRHKVKRLCSLL